MLVVAELLDLTYGLQADTTSWPPLQHACHSQFILNLLSTVYPKVIGLFFIDISLGPIHVPYQLCMKLGYF